MSKAKTRKRRPNNMPPKTWNVTELLYAFIGILTERDLPLIFSRKHNCAPISEMVAAFIKANKLPEPRPDYPKVIWPKGTDHLTNEPEKTNMVAFQPLEATPAIEMLRATLNRVDPSQHDYVIATFIGQLKMNRENKIKAMTRDLEMVTDKLIDARERNNTLDNILRGTYSFVTAENGKNG